MKAVVYDQYGLPQEVMSVVNLDIPKPKADEVLVQVHASSVNPFEYYHVTGRPLMARIPAGWSHPKHRILGADFSGVVKEVGDQVDKFKVGDRVFGEGGYGAYAQWVSIKPEKMNLMPAGRTFEEMAAIPMVGLTALQSLRDHGRLQAGERVLINGSSGGIGTIAVQLAKLIGARVTGVCGPKNTNMVRSLGADAVMDYTTEDLRTVAGKFDLIIDNVGNLCTSDYRRLLTKKGRCVVVGFTNAGKLIDIMIRGSWISRTTSQSIAPMTAEVKSDDLAYLGKLIQNEEVKPIVDRTYGLDEVPEAIAYVGTKRARGKVVIRIVKN